MLRRSILSLAVCVALLAAGDARAYGDDTIAQFFPVSGNCSADDQTCDSIPEVRVRTDGVLRVQFAAAPSHCSDIRITFLVDGKVAGKTGFLGAGQQSAVFDVGPVSPGKHRIGLLATGRLGGCNTGVVGNWSGNLTVFRSGTDE